MSGICVQTTVMSGYSSPNMHLYMSSFKEHCTGAGELRILVCNLRQTIDYVLKKNLEILIYELVVGKSMLLLLYNNSNRSSSSSILISTISKSLPVGDWSIWMP